MSVACTSINFWSDRHLCGGGLTAVCSRLLALVSASPELQTPRPHTSPHASQIIYFVTTVYQCTHTPSSSVTKKISLSQAQVCKPRAGRPSTDGVPSLSHGGSDHKPGCVKGRRAQVWTSPQSESSGEGSGCGGIAVRCCGFTHRFSR